MTEAIRIRPAAEEDLPELVELCGAVRARAGFRAGRIKAAGGLSLMLESPFAELLVAECGGRVAGFCGVQLQISTAMGSYAAQIEDLVLHPEFRRRGIGSRLLDAAGAWAKQRGAGGSSSTVTTRISRPCASMRRGTGYGPICSTILNSIFNCAEAPSGLTFPPEGVIVILIRKI